MEIVTKLAPIALALIMLGLGLNLTLEDFFKVFKKPKIFLIGLFSQIILLPVIAFLLILIFNTPPNLAIGVMIIAAAPGGGNFKCIDKICKRRCCIIYFVNCSN